MTASHQLLRCSDETVLLHPGRRVLLKPTQQSLATETMYQDKILTLKVDHFVRGNAEERTYTRLELGDWVNVVPLTVSYELVAIRQYRQGLGVFTVEVPAGSIDPGEEPEQAACRELLEETGIKSAGLIA